MYTIWKCLALVTPSGGIKKISKIPLMLSFKETIISNILHIGNLKKDNATAAPWNITYIYVFIFHINMFNMYGGFFYHENFGWSIVLLLQG